MCYNKFLNEAKRKEFLWDKAKNIKLIRERGISFENIKEALNDNCLVDILAHRNQEHYSEQRIMLVNIENYIYAVPFLETKDNIILKTIFPSRKYTDRE